jgi:hypothetical protein
MGGKAKPTKHTAKEIAKKVCLKSEFVIKFSNGKIIV